MTRSPTNVAILGSTGSIGRSTLDVIGASGGALAAVGLSAHESLPLLNEQACQCHPRWIVACDGQRAASYSWSLPEGTELLSGPDALEEAVRRPEVDIVVTAIVGSAGLRSTWAALDAGKKVALANKETLVVAGPLVMRLAAERGAPIVPVNSEHSAIFQALQAGRRNEVKRIVLTASGGPFRHHSPEQLSQVTPAEALHHPTWTMGRKITIDSATMMNKALEMIEARWLFDLPPEKIEVVVHPQSIVHSFVEFVNGSILAQMSPPDMRLPIQYALNYPERVPGIAAKLNWQEAFRLEFEPPDPARFPALTLGSEVAHRGGTAGAVVNAANEVAVASFLSGEIGFTEIVPLCRSVLEHHDFESNPSLERLLEARRLGSPGGNTLGLYLISTITLAGALSWALMILKVAIGLGLVIFVHELGHFAVAKFCGVKCEKFYLGFDIGGLKLFKIQWGETEYGIGILPLGGYVKMLGQDDNPSGEAADRQRSANEPLDPRSYRAKSVPQRMAIISAGVIMNLIFAVIFAAVAYEIGVKDHACGVSKLLPGEAAWEADMHPGDKIIQVNDLPADEPLRFRDLTGAVIFGNHDEGVRFRIQRDGVPEPFWITLFPQKTKGRLAPSIGVVSPFSTTLLHEHPIREGSPTADAGFEPDDQIVAINGEPARDYAELTKQLAHHATETIQVKVERPKKTAGQVVKDSSGQPEIDKTLDLSVPPNPMKTLGLEMTFGPITAIQENSPADHARLRKGDLLLTIDGQPVGDPLTLPERLRKLAGTELTLEVSRPADGAGSPETISIPITPRDADWWEESAVSGSPQGCAALGIVYRVSNQVGAVEPASPADKAKIKAGAEIVSAQFILPPDGDESIDIKEPMKFGADDLNWPVFHNLLQELPPGSKVKLTLADKKKAELEPVATSQWFNPDRGFRTTPVMTEVQAQNPAQAVMLGAQETRESVGQVYGFLRRLGTRISVLGLGGPITIFKQAGAAASQGFSELLIFLTMLSANLAVINFLPIPMLDGGHMVFLLLEGIMRRPVSDRVVLAFQAAGLVFIISLMLFVLSLDLGIIARH